MAVTVTEDHGKRSQTIARRLVVAIGDRGCGVKNNGLGGGDGIVCLRCGGGGVEGGLGGGLITRLISLRLL